jgi:hypothetical protein
VEPLTLGVLAVKFAIALLNHDGAETTRVVGEYLEERPEARQEPERALAREIEVRPYFGRMLVDAMNGDALSFTWDVQEFLGQDGLLRRAFGISRDMEKYQLTNKCPVGNHFTAFPAWIKPDGTQASRFTTWGMLYEISPLMRCRCRRGHEWLVFPMKA